MYQNTSVIFLDIDGVFNCELFYKNRQLNSLIIDDDSDMLLNQQSHFFQTDAYSGLTPNICYKIKRFITGKTF